MDESDYHPHTVASAIDRQNSSLRMRLAALDSTERIQRLAAARGMVLPPAGDYRYLNARPRVDGARAAQFLGALADFVEEPLALFA